MKNLRFSPEKKGNSKSLNEKELNSPSLVVKKVSVSKEKILVQSEGKKKDSILYKNMSR